MFNSHPVSSTLVFIGLLKQLSPTLGSAVPSYDIESSVVSEVTSDCSLKVYQWMWVLESAGFVYLSLGTYSDKRSAKLGSMSFLRENTPVFIKNI